MFLSRRAISLVTIIIEDLFKPLFSPKSTNRRKTEEAIIMKWIEYLRNVEGNGNCM